MVSSRPLSLPILAFLLFPIFLFSTALPIQDDECSDEPDAAAEAAASPSNSSLSTPSNTIRDSNTTTNFQGQFIAGADIGTLMRHEAIPGRTYYDYDGVTVKDPVQMLGDAGVNAIRVTVERGQCLGPTNFVNNASTGADELLYKLDWGCIDIQVKTAERAVAQGMRIVLTINQGFTIPKELESLSYPDMLANVQTEAKRQLQPFLDAKIVPDVILLENEGTDGFLFIEESTGRNRGKIDNKASIDTVNKELCGQIPTGNMASYPQLTGYYKAEILACNDAITAAGLSTDTVRYGLHSHGQYVQWKEGVVHGPNPPSESDLKDSSGNACGTQVIPTDILAQNASQLLTIAGFSAYPDPMTPTDINSEDAQKATLDRLQKTLTQLQGYAEAYGQYEDGPFKGQYKLQGFGVEYATAYTEDQLPQEQALTELMWQMVKGYSAFLGMMWWEPFYVYNDWFGGQATLVRRSGSGDVTGVVPTDLVKTWGKEAVSPWK